MSAIPASLTRKLVVNEQGDPLEVIIPYQEFVDFIEIHGLDLSEDEKAEILEAEADIESGTKDAFVSLEKLEAELDAECTA
ncbi:MAG: hypothetical protein ACI8UO_002730 [Verrucomicrobiales bacterium]|jgi:hypothetical protein